MNNSTLIQQIQQTPSPQIQLQTSKSAFTPVVHRPTAVRQSPINIFEPSPMQKHLLYMSALMRQQSKQMSEQQIYYQVPIQQQSTMIPIQLFQKVQSPNKQVTPTQFLKAFGGKLEQINNTPNMVRSESIQHQLQQQHQLFVNGPRGFSYEVLLPQKSLLNRSPLSGDTGMNSDGSADLDKDMDSTDFSQQSASNQSLQNSQQNLTEKSKKQSRNQLEINGIVIDNILSSDDLNECVDFLLKKEKPEIKKDSKGATLRVIRHNSSAKSKEKKKRQRKNLDQHSILSEYFDRNPNWDKITIQRLSDELGLKESQIYKWNWDQRKKTGLSLEEQ
eukprot:403373602